ncbi:hypothetical protein MesoLj131c_63570 [Mesorhizobium sp. 131-3-5]|nr:hypothetical protein MesoLj131c_63570 [Mesorhizobium sp. 131-3-5]
MLFVRIAVQFGATAMTQPMEEYIRFQTANEALRQARALGATGDLAAAFEMLCTALERTIKDADEDIEDLVQVYYDLDSRVG